MSSKKLRSKPGDSKVSLHRCDKCDLQFFSSLLNEHRSECGNVTHSFIRNGEIFAKEIKFSPLPDDLKAFKDKVCVATLTIYHMANINPFQAFIFLPEIVIKCINLELGQPVQLNIPSLEPIVRIVWIGKDGETIYLSDNGNHALIYYNLHKLNQIL